MKQAIPGLTGIRGVAALWVVFYHLQDAAKSEPRLAWLTALPWAREGYRGVDLFFVLSGFILMYVHQNDFLSLDWSRTRRYVAARFWRVYPLNAVTTLIIIALAMALPGFYDPAAFTPAAVIQSLALAQRWFMPDFGAINGPAWSLSVEILGYAVFPLIALGLNRIGSRHALVLTAAGCLVLLVVASVHFGFASRNVTGRITILRMFPSFIAGAALATFFAAGHTRTPGWMARHASGVAIASVLACLVAYAIPAAAVLAVFPIAALVLALAFQQGPVDRFMASAPILWLGRISFSLYLTHFTVLNLILWTTASTDARHGPFIDATYLLVVLLVVVMVAAAVYYGFERPIAQMRRTRVRRAPSSLPS
jgi:peptidoglycan/LPS O-acetylase OafA/YrhL